VASELLFSVFLFTFFLIFASVKFKENAIHKLQKPFYINSETQEDKKTAFLLFKSYPTYF